MVFDHLFSFCNRGRGETTVWLLLGDDAGCATGQDIVTEGEGAKARGDVSEELGSEETSSESSEDDISTMAHTVTVKFAMPLHMPALAAIVTVAVTMVGQEVLELGPLILR